MAEDDDNLMISIQDVQNHVLTYGLDVYPALDVRNEMVRAQEYFNTLQAHWPLLYQKLSFAPQNNEFRISADLPCATGSATCSTLVFTPRGPVFTFPVQLLTPQGVQSCIGEEQSRTTFEEARRELRRLFPSLQVLRLGLVRHVVFGAGQTRTVPWLAARFAGFQGAHVVGGSVTLVFGDDRCNIRITVQPTTIRKRAQHRLAGVMSEESEHGLQVFLDVNNREMRAQSDEDMETTLERARSLWPGGVLDFIHRRVES